MLPWKVFAAVLVVRTALVHGGEKMVVRWLLLRGTSKCRCDVVVMVTMVQIRKLGGGDADSMVAPVT